MLIFILTSLLCLFLMQNCKIHHSVVGLRSCISEGAIIEDTLLMGADYYEVKPSRFETLYLVVCKNSLEVHIFNQFQGDLT